MLRGAIFDLDGTVLDSMHMWDGLGADYLRSVGCVPQADLNDRIRALSLEQAACFFQQAYGIDLSAEAIVAEIKRMIRHFYVEEVMAKPGVEGLLKHLQRQGVRMCIATAADHDLAEAALERCGLMKYFMGIFTCSEAGSSKEQPDIYRRALQLLGAPKEQTAVFEDAVHALRTAKKDGFVTIAVYDASEPAQAAARALADCCLPDYAGAEAAWDALSATKG